MELDHPEMVAWQMTRWIPSCNVLGSEFTPIFFGDNIGLFPLTPTVSVGEKRSGVELASASFRVLSVSSKSNMGQIWGRGRSIGQLRPIVLVARFFLLGAGVLDPSSPVPVGSGL